MGGGGGRGSKGRGRTQRRHFRQNRENVWKRSRTDNNNTTAATDNGSKLSGWEPFATQNPAFDEYYKEQGIVSAEEWDAFVKVLRSPLPAAFRINSSTQFCMDIRLQLENDFMKSLQAEDPDGVEVEAIKPLAWYPENLAWHSNYSRMQLRKNQNLERFHEFLKLENEIGNITRQEAVSMVPPLFLDVCSDHVVLDMCAAPGSKTFQLLEIIHKKSFDSGRLPDGMVVANDVDVQRSNLLIHQTKRMCTSNLIVTNHEAQNFPSCRISKDNSNILETGFKDGRSNQLLFDRVLCDVPCSGDGTLRKAPDIWRKWNVGMGNGLHGLQVQIAMRGLALLKVGGRMVYSTCSMNPVENEAVVAEILRRCGGSVELVDVSNELSQLVRRPGLKKWKVCDKGTWFASYKDVPQFRKGGVVPGMFPSGGNYEGPTERNNANGIGSDDNGDVNYENGAKSKEDPTDVMDEEDSCLPLERCMRILPHDQNSGAFFIAVFHKYSHLPAIQEKPIRLYVNSNSKNGELPEKSTNEVKGDISCTEANLADEIILKASSSEAYLEDEDISKVSSDADIPESNEPDEADVEHGSGKLYEANEEKAEVADDVELSSKKASQKRQLQVQGKWKGVDPVVFFKDDGIMNSIKTFYGIDESFPFSGHLVARNCDTKRVKRIYYISKSVKDVLELNFLVGQQLKIASVGLKMFERQTSKEGTSSPCAFRISSEGLPLILPYITKQILCASLTDFKHLLQYKSIKFADFVDVEFGEKASKLMLGCCVVVLNKGVKVLAGLIRVDASTIAIGCWKGRAGLNVMVTALDCQELLERLLIRMETEKGSCLLGNKPSNVESDEPVNMEDGMPAGKKSPLNVKSDEPVSMRVVN